ncbi:MAG TPA: YIP1 family protein [Gemmatimonadaceae bacterium]|nr:YIP1 family protein [Gemmatimonadaceae bacterium]
MTDTAPVAGPADAPPKGLVARILGVFFSPRATYASVAARPQWFGVLAFTSLVIAGGFFILLSTEVGQQAAFDQQTQMIESFGIKLNDAAYERMQEGIDRARYTTAAGQLIGIPLVSAVIAGLLLGIFNALLGGDATYKQVFAVLAHSSVISALQNVFAIPLDYVRETLSSPTSLLVFLPFIDNGSFLGRLLGAIDLFQIWATVSLAIGLGVLYKRRTTPIAIWLFVVYFVIVAAVAAVRTALS